MIRIAVCEDNPIMLDTVIRMVHRYASAHPSLGIMPTRFSSALHLLESHDGKDFPFHVYLLDIMLPMMSGIELACRIRKCDEQAIIIFMTSCTEHALEAYKASPLQYLVKPISETLLFQVLEKACLQVTQSADSHMMVRTKSGLAYVRYHQIAYVEYMNHTMMYHLTTGKTLTSMVLRESFGELMASCLQDMRFLRPHASFVVNMDQVQAITPREFEMLDGGIVPISKRAYPMARSRFTEYILFRHGGVAQ